MRARYGTAGAVLAAATLLLASCTANDESSQPQQAPTSSATATPTGEPGPDEATTNSTPTDNGSTTTQPSTPDPFEPREFTIAMNGDTLLHEGLWATAEIDAQRTGRGAMDFRPLLANMRPTFTQADLAICHMETPLAPRGGPYSGYPLFSAPPDIVPALKWSGFDACTTASNHSVDQGFDGLVRTIQDFDAAGIAHTGTFASRRVSREPLLLEADDVTVALISATYGLNGLPLPAGAPWSVNLIDPAAIREQARQARDAGAEVVIVALHWGLEYTHEPTADQIAVAQRLAASPDIDLIYGHHAHVVQPYDRVKGTWVLYGQGNAVAQQATDVAGLYDGNTARVTFEERPSGRFGVAMLEYIPTMTTTFDGATPMRYLDVRRALDQPRYDALDGQLRATFGRVTDTIDLEGALDRGVVAGD